MSEIRATTISDAAGTGPIALTKQSAAKAWANYSQTGSSINGSFSVSSITDSSTGTFSVNMTNAFSDAFYSGSGISRGTSLFIRSALFTSTSASLGTVNTSGTSGDYEYNCPSFHGDLA